jgi:8-amino-7-oxononanoate synthase
MNLFAQTLDKLRAKADRSSAARPFSDLSAYRTIAQHRKIGAMLNIESPFFRVTDGLQGDKVLIDGKPVINFAWTDYLALSQHPELRAAAKAAVDQYGASVSASRMVSGDTSLHRELEREIADFIGVEASLVFTSGHSANVSTIGTLMSEGDLIVYDEFMHNSGFIGTRLSGATARSFRHNRMDRLEAILRDERAKYRNALVIVEGQYSADGDVPDLARVIELKEKYGAWLMVDEAHSLGVIGDTGRGIAEYCKVDPRKVDIWMGVLSKAIGSVGGYIAGSNDLIDILRYTAPSFVFSVGLSPANTAASIAALRILKGEPARMKRLHENGALFLKEARERGMNTGQALGFGMLPIIIGPSTRAAKLVQRMYERGINVSLIIYPGVPLNAGRLRFFLTSEHKPDEILAAITMAEEELKNV